MKRIFTSLALFLIFAQCSRAQQLQGVAAFVKNGYYSLSNSSSISKIAPADYVIRSDHFFTIGVECYFRSDNIILAIDGNVGVQNGKSIYREGVKFSSGTAYSRAGWILLENKAYWIYPTFGVGVATINMNTYDSKNNLNETINTRINKNLSFDIGANMDVLLDSRMAEDGFASIMAGLRAGYRFSVRNKTWKDFYGDRIAQMPPYSQNGFYITTTIGLGSFLKGNIFQKAD